MSDTVNTAAVETSERPLPTTVVEALQRTKEVLQEQGRTTRHNFRDGKVCLNGAVSVAVGLYGPTGNRTEGAFPERDRRWNLKDDAMEVLNNLAPRLDAIGYNDDPATTDDDIAALIDRAIAAQQTEAVDQ